MGGKVGGKEGGGGGKEGGRGRGGKLLSDTGTCSL